MRNRYVLLADLIAVVLCALGAFVLRLDWFFPQSKDYTHAFTFYVASALVAKPLVFYAFGLYRRFWRYAAIRDLAIVFVAVSFSSVAMAVIVTGGLLVQLLPFFPRSILAIDWLLTLAAAGGVRLSVRLIAESFSSTWTAKTAPAPTLVKRVLVAGAGDAGALVVREMHKNPHLAMRPVGFLDDDAAKTGKRIYDVPVLGKLEDLADIVAINAVNEVIIAMPKAPGAVVREVLESCQRAGVTARAVPGMFELLDGGVSVNRLREVDIADLLRRRPIEARPEAGLYLQGQTVAITGAGGSIGAELARQVARAQVAELILLGHGENSIFDIAAHLRASQPAVKVQAIIADIRDTARLTELLRRHRPSIVFHAAAHKHVPLMEAHPEEAVTNNVLGTRNVVAAALAAGVDRFVLISTDKAVQPASVMGATKRVAELIVHDAARRHNRRFLAVRFGNVLGSRGSVVPAFKRQIEQGGPVTVTHPDMKRFFMTIPEAVYLVLKAGGLATTGGELFVLNMGEAVKITDLASDLIHLSGLSTEEIPIVYTGLRPGEKLEEALWEPDSRIEPADGPDMFRVWEREPVPEPGELAAAIEALDRAARQGDVLQIHRLLSDLLPSFVSPLAHGQPRAWTP
jgi:FlaA1/EpsC-like NDP-sugar epimerase